MSRSSDDEDFVTYGNPLDEIYEDDIPKKKPITIEDQYATDEHGRRRFHGAFTGGFTAGFGNSVGSLEGWQPSDFRSSRNARCESKRQTVFDFMDDEDKGQHGICPMAIKVKPLFNDKSAESTARKRAHQVMSEGPIPGVPVAYQAFTPVRDTIGVKLLMRMGWRPGQGVGPRVSKKEKIRLKKLQESQKIYGCSLPSDNVKSSDGESSDSEVDINFDDLTFAPDDYKFYIVEPKRNSFGLGYEGIDRKPILSSELVNTSKLTVNGKTIRGHAFGVSVFEDDDDDIYHHDDLSNYDFSLGPERKSNKKIFDNEGCIEGFHTARQPANVREKYTLPEIPIDFRPLKLYKFRWGTENKPETKKKITNAVDRMKIMDDDESNINLNQTVFKNEETVIKFDDIQLITEPCDPKLSEIQLPLNTCTSVKPFINDCEKQNRFDKFLMLKKSGLKDRLVTIQPTSMTAWEKERERSEFEQVARLYRPLSEDMANRFTSGGFQENVHDILAPVAKSVTSANQSVEEAAKKKMFGALTRKKFKWIPERILCKRFNVPEPETFLEKVTENKKSQKLKSASIFEFLKSEVSLGRTRAINLEDGYCSNTMEIKTEPDCNNLSRINNKSEGIEKNDAPNEVTEIIEEDDELPDVTDKADLFKAIFLSSSESELEEEEEDNVLKSSIEKYEEQLILSKELRMSQQRILYSPPRGIFANLDLDSMRNKCTNAGTISETLQGESTDNPSKVENNNLNIGPELYGPMLPVQCRTAVIDKSDWVEEEKSSSSVDIWVEKRHKQKKHKKHKKHRTKHKKR